MESLFKVAERGSTPAREVVGGLTTFLAMAYIIVVNPMILSEVGVPFQAALTATCLGAALLTIVMGLAANRPIALAPGMELNAVVAYTLCVGMGVDWRVAMAVVLIEGVAILILVLCGLRRAIMDAIPADLRLAIGIGIGLFIAFIGLKGGGVIVDDASTLLALGDFSAPACIVSLTSILVAVVPCVARSRRAAHIHRGCHGTRGAVGCFGASIRLSFRARLRNIRCTASSRSGDRCACGGPRLDEPGAPVGGIFAFDERFLRYDGWCYRSRASGRFC